MKLVIDIGNTLVKVALFREKKIVKETMLKECSLASIDRFLQKQLVDRTILCTVKDLNKQTLEVIEKYQPLVFNEKTPIPLEIKYKKSKTLGKDRIASAVAASCFYQEKNIVVVDFGSCLTIDVISEDKEYLGGRISPGLMMRYKALHNYTDKLPLCKITNNRIFFGDDTHSSINSGVQEGMIDEVNAFITRFTKENKNTVVIFTGGDCFFFEKALKNSIFANPFLVMEGLNEILDYNE